MANILPVKTLSTKDRWMGIVLCGGKSSCGTHDKGLFKKGGLSWVEHCAEILAKNTGNVVFSVNQKQFPTYKERFQDREIIIDSNELAGPISGILSVFSAFRIFHFLVLACDFLNMRPEILSFLQKEHKTDPGYDFYLFREEDKIYFSCGVYTNHGLEKIYELYNQGKLNHRSMKFILENGKTKYCTIPEEWKEFFQKNTDKTGLDCEQTDLQTGLFVDAQK
jgi:molybdenum cofactor guanylyltransferase